MQSDELAIPLAAQRSFRRGKLDAVPRDQQRDTVTTRDVDHLEAQAAGAPVDEEVLTYREAAQLLKVSARTLERWTREGLIPYIRLPERGAWSGVRFSRNQLLRWLRQRTVKER